MSFSVSRDAFSLMAKSDASHLNILWKEGALSLDMTSPKTKWQDGWTLSIR
jgi:hypothetical protein